jgi:pimeloyl-ACP methyl ester carboxylesterase
MPYFDHDDITLYYETHGSGPPLLLTAGFASDSQSWQPVISFWRTFNMKKSCSRGKDSP